MGKRAGLPRRAGVVVIAIILLTGVAATLFLLPRRTIAPAKPSTPASGRAAPPVTPSTEEGQGKALVEKGNQLLAQGQVELALQAYREAAALLPQDEDVQYNLGIALTRLGQTNEAMVHYETALRLFPEYAEAHNNLGNLLLRAGRRPDAIGHFRAAIRAMPDYASAHNNLGNALRLSGQFDEARECFLKAAKLNTNYWEAYFNLANIYHEQQQPAEAAAALRTVLQLKPDFVPAQKALEALDRSTQPPLRPLSPSP